MQYLGLSAEILKNKGAIHTAKEISQQPDLWKNTWKALYKEQSNLQAFLSKSLDQAQRIILTGAGTSSFIGISLKGSFQRNTGIITESIPTTDLVSHPMDYLMADIPTLMVSFARSGNSPESEAAVAIADTLCKNCFHLIITCNPDGKLAQYPARQKFVFTLPEEANDQSLAMTSSYSGMFLAGILLSKLPDLERSKSMVDTLAIYAEKAIRYYAEELKQIAEMDFKRAVFLGSGPLLGTATESHLKLQELTDGKIICKHDSFLGFRHGPKAVIDQTTLVVYHFSNDRHSLKYEKDLVNAMKNGNPPMLEIGIMESVLPDMKLDRAFYFSENGSAITEEFLSLVSVVPAQILSFYKSMKLGLSPDAPSVSGAITRVVEGVQIYDLKKNR